MADANDREALRHRDRVEDGADNEADVGTDARVHANPKAEPGTSATSPGTASLESLAPRYDEEQHGTYLKHLEEAVKDSRNRNIALTGRYGIGKSSVLDEFERKQKNSLRLAISTLGPDSEGTNLTNRIQKELVKQLLYRADSRQLRHSRFNRITPLSTKRAFLESAGAVAVLGLLLWLLGWFPPVAGTSTGSRVRPCGHSSSG